MCILLLIALEFLFETVLYLGHDCSKKAHPQFQLMPTLTCSGLGRVAIGYTLGCANLVLSDMACITDDPDVELESVSNSEEEEDEEQAIKQGGQYKCLHACLQLY